MNHPRIESRQKDVSSMRCLAVAAFAGMAAFPLVAADVEWKPQNGKGEQKSGR